MSDSTAVATKRKLRPARKQVKAGDIDKSEGPQPGKEYSESGISSKNSSFSKDNADQPDFWYNKWAGGDKEDALAK